MGNFATGVTVVTYPNEPPHGLTANAFSSVSLDPPLVLVCIDHDTTSYELLEETDLNSFCINFLSEDQQHLGEFFANISDLEDSPFNVESTKTKVTGSPVFTESLAYVDCEIWETIEAGDHTIYIGEAQSADVLNPEADALTFFRGDWGSLP
jgi:flavin reductase (DIM6/NTAB) family NADH-FMN oxidoreductase RutF